MLAGKVRSKSNRLYVDGNIKLLKFAAIFGANASGKSNLISAMEFAQSVIIQGFPKDSAWKYCKLDSANKDKISYFEFEIQLGRRYYSYGFETILSKQSVTGEWLYEVSPQGKDKEIFSRDVLNRTYSLTKFFKKKNLIEKLNLYADDIKSDGSVLFLKILNQNKDTLYSENEEANILRMVFEWFREQLDINFPDKPISDYSYFIANQDFKKICSTLSAFGTGITKYSIVETSPEKTSKDLPRKLVDEILRKLTNKQVAEEHNGKKPTIVLRGGKSFYIFEIDNDGNIACKTIQFNHGNNQIFFDLSEESDGTNRLLDLLTILFEKRSGRVYVIDEIDRCLHPQLTYKLISEYLKASVKKEIQLIVTTHESRLLDFNLLRKDEIWFIDKKSSGSSYIYSLDEYNERFDKKIDRAYLEGRYGGVPLFSTIFPVEEV